jgi:hypothetical protein
MPLASSLQTFFLPSQQFWEALKPLMAPQMLPGGLQAVPLLQRTALGSQVTPYPAVLIWSGVPPQQAAVESQ